jgi:hypothetical protein
MDFAYCSICNKVFFDKDYFINKSLKISDSSKPNIYLSDLFDDLTSEDYSYLSKRNPFITKEVADSYGFRSMNNSILIPVKVEGVITNWLARFTDLDRSIRIDGDIVNKYITIGKGLNLYIPKVVSRTKLIIVEGVFDAIACLKLYTDYTPIALIGTHASRPQIDYINTHFQPSEILVRLDSTKLSNMIFRSALYRTVKSNYKVIESDGTDPEEYLRHKYEMGDIH